MQTLTSSRPSFMPRYSCIWVVMYSLLFPAVLFAQQSPTAPAQGMNIVSEGNTTLYNGDIDGGLATGVNLSLQSSFNLCTNAAGTFTVSGDSRPTALIVGNQITFDGGSGANLNNNTFAKVGNYANARVWDYDQNNNLCNTRVTRSSGGFDDNPRLTLQTNQSAASVKQSGVFSFFTAFPAFRANATTMSGYTNTITPTYNPGNSTSPKVTLANGKNVWNITGAQLKGFNELNFQTTPDASHYLIINVNVSGSFTWDTQFNMNGIGDTQGEFILFNFYNATGIVLSTNSTIMGTIFCPNADLDKNNSSNINGQVIAKSFIHRNGEVHYHPFVPACIPNCASPITVVITPTNAVLCNGATTTLTASGGTGYLWASGETTASVVKGAGTYTVTATGAVGCSAIASATLTNTNVTASIATSSGSGGGSLISPTTPALGFNVFLKNGMTVTSSESEGPVAVGGDLTISGDHNITLFPYFKFKVGGVNISLVVGGKVNYSGGNRISLLSNGYAKIGNANNSTPWYLDTNGAASPMRITPGTDYNGSPRIEFSASSTTLGVNATTNPIFQANVIDFNTAFTTMSGYCTTISTMTDNALLTDSNGNAIPHTGLPNQVKITLNAGTNVLNVTGGDMNNVTNFTYNNQPDSTHRLVVNVNAAGTFNWSVWSSGSIGGTTNCRYVLYNFYNTTTLNIAGYNAVEGTIFAPNTNISKSSNYANVEGQIIAQSYLQNAGGEIHFAECYPKLVTPPSNNPCSSTSTLTASGGGTYVWSSGETTAAITKGSGTYTVTVTSNGCTSTASATVVSNSPTAIITGTATTCNGSTTTLTASGGTSYVWSSGATTAAVTKNAGTYTVTATGANGCTASATVVVTNTNVTAAITGTTGVCSGYTTTLTASGGTSYVWASGETTASVTKPVGTYTVTVTSAGCTAAATATITTVACADYGDAPASYGTAAHTQPAGTPTVYLGSLIDYETTQLNSSDAKGDDNNNLADEDGVTFYNNPVPGNNLYLSVVAATNGAKVSMWIDWDHNGTFDASEQVLTDVFSLTTPNIQFIPVPKTAVAGNTFVRTRISTAAGTTATGTAADGEVEDYMITTSAVAIIGDFVWKDTNNNGIQDAGETGIAAAPVNLYRAGDTRPYKTTITDANGAYLFYTEPGSYFLEFPNPSVTGYTASPKTAGSNTAVDSDPDPTTGRTATFNAPAGQNLTYDAGFAPKTNTVTSCDGHGAYSRTDWTQTLSLAKFDAALGTLTKASLATSASLFTNMGFENTGNGNANFNTTFNSSIDLTPPPSIGISPVSTALNYTYKKKLATFDGRKDFAGTSGFFKPDSLVTNTLNQSYTTGLSSFTGTTGQTLAFTFATASLASISTSGGNMNYQINTLATGSVCLTYEYAIPPTVTISGATAVCGNAGVLLTANTATGIAFVWSSGATTTSTTVYPPSSSSPTTYTVTVTAANGLTATATTAITRNDVTAAIAGNTVTCNGAATTLTASGGGTYVWSSGETTAAVTKAAGTYSVTVTAVGGCTATASATVRNEQGSVGNYVWADTNGNGTNDEPASAGINGVSVELWNAGADGVAGTADDSKTATTTTANNANGNAGYYNFVVCATGAYYVHFPTTNNGNVLTTATTTAATDGNSDANTATGNSPVFTINVNGIGTAKDNATIDAGYVPLPAAIGDRVWSDDNHNGIQDAGEVGVASVTVTLYDVGGNFVATTVTDGYGNYHFTGLSVGTYTVGFSLPVNYTFTTQGIGTGSGTATDSDVNPATGRTRAVTLTSGQTNNDLDAGIYRSSPATCSIGDRVWYDTNANGKQDAGENGVASVTVTLYDGTGNTVATTLTNSAGIYSFTGLPAGTYAVGFAPPAGYTFTTRTTNTADGSDADPNAGVTFGRTPNYTLAAGETYSDFDAGIVPQATDKVSIGDFVWNDLNSNAVQDANELGIEGITVTLYAADGVTVIATTTTDVYGHYLFPNLTPDVYVVGFSGFASGVLFVARGQGSDNTIDSNVDPATGKTSPFGVFAGHNDLTIDCGVHYCTSPEGALGDFVWNDANANGIQDATEAGVGGVTVVLYAANGTTVLARTATDTRGYYLFPELADGNYIIGFQNLPAGFVFTTRTLNTATGSDADLTTGKTPTIHLSGGATDLTWDAGIYPCPDRVGVASIGDFVWNDTNNNGIQDSGETGVAGVTVTLYGSNGTTVQTTTTTDALGYYIFPNLVAGTYFVGFSNLPTNYTFTNQYQGSDASADSDADPTTGISRAVNLLYGRNDLTIDAGIYNNAANSNRIGDRVWFDANTNGIQDAGERGVAGVSVTLYDASNAAPVMETTSSRTGYYQFMNIHAGNYYVKFGNLPDGYTFTNANAGTDTNLDSNPNPATGKTNVFAVGVNTDDQSIDAGIVGTRAALGDFVWYDNNSNGKQDAGERGIAGVTVTLYAAATNPDGSHTALTKTTTDANGYYSFSNLSGGTYIVGFSGTPDGLTFVTPHAAGTNTDNDSDANPLKDGTAQTDPITLLGGTTRNDIDAGLTTLTAGLGDRVWNDANANGIQDAGESGVAGVTVTLYAANGTTVVATTVTDEKGSYSFDKLGAGTYIVGFSGLPPHTTFTNKGSGTATDSDANPATGKTDAVTLAAGEYNPNIDAGLILASFIGDRVWLDDNQDGLQNGSEGPLPVTVTVNLYRAADLNTLYRTTTTTDKGLYLFDDLAADAYVVEFPAVNSYTRTVQTIGGDNGSAADYYNGKTPALRVAAGQGRLDADAGYYVGTQLPIKLIYLKAAVKACQVVLDFATATEEHNDHFDIERSSDGVTFNKIAEMKGAGNATSNRYYTYTDAHPQQNAYYRLVQVDDDGTATLYPYAKAVSMGDCFGNGTDGISKLYPNPNSGADVNFKFYTAEITNTTAVATVYDAVGRVAATQTIPIRNGANTVSLDISSLVSGSYTVRIAGEDWFTEPQQLLIIRN